MTALPKAPCSGSRERYLSRATLHSIIGAQNEVRWIPPEVSTAFIHSLQGLVLLYEGLQENFYQPG